MTSSEVLAVSTSKNNIRAFNRGNFRKTVLFLFSVLSVCLCYLFIFPGVGTKIDPTLCRADRLVGQVLGAVGALPDIFTELEISYFLLRRLLGVRTEGDKKGAKVHSP